MRSLRISIILSLIVFAISCSPVYNVQYDYLTQTDLSGLKTFNWLPTPAKADTDTFDLERVKEAVNLQLEAKGLTMSSDSPDFLIAAHMGKKSEISVQDWGYGFAPRDLYWGGVPPMNVYQYEQGTLVLDFVNPKSKQMIWRGSANADLTDATTPEKRQKIIDEAVENILKNFPPPSK